MHNIPSPKHKRSEEEDATSIFRGGDEDTEQMEAVTAVVSDEDAAALFRKLAEQEASDAKTIVEEHTSVLSDSDLHSGNEPSIEIGEELTSVLSDGDPELTVGAPEGTSILVDSDLEFTSGSAAQRSNDFDALPVLDPRALLLGRAFGGFRIVRELASGGMASVFLARKDGPGRVSQHAAIKVVHPHLSCQSGFVDMFLDEARIVSCVNHPNVCRVLDFGTAEGTYYLAMEYVLGETWGALQAALAADDAGKKALPAISAYVIAQAAEGLHAAHEATDDQGDSLHIVHRDVSPQNIFVAYDGTVRVLDFGIARAADRITTTQAGTVKGRLAYMAPEQMEGKSIDRRADIWSLGVVLREALENRRLFRKGSDAETMMAVTSDPLPEWFGNSSPKLREIVNRALERELEARYPTAHHLGVELMRFCRSQASPVSMPEVSTWMTRLFKHKLEEKRLMLQEKAPEPRTGDTGPIGQPWRSAAATPGFTPSAATGKPRTKQDTYSSSTQGAIAEQRASMVAKPVSRAAAGVLLFAVVAGGAGAGVWFARNGSKKAQFAETTLAGAGAGASSAQPSVGAPTVTPMAPTPPSVPPTGKDTVSDTGSGSGTASGTDTGSVTGTVTGSGADTSSITGTAPKSPRPKEAKLPKETKAPKPAPVVTTTTAAAPTPPPAPAPAPAAVQGPPGTVVVAYLGGWAEVYLGSKLLGTTPGRFTVPSGKQTITIKPFGTGTPEHRTVEVPSGGTAKLAISPSSP